MEPTYYVTRKPVQRYSDEPVSYQTIIATKTPPDDKNYTPNLVNLPIGADSGQGLLYTRYGKNRNNKQNALHV